MKKRCLLIFCFIFLLVVCGCNKKQKLDTENNEQKNEIKEEIKADDTKIEEEAISDEVVEEGSMNKPVSSDKKEEKEEDKLSNIDTSNQNKEEPTKEETKISNIIGTWIYNNEEYVYVFKEDKIVIIKTQINNIKEHSYTIDGNKIIVDGKIVQNFEIKGDKLYLGYTVLTKANDNYVYPSIYNNLDIFYGTWKLETPDKVITLEDGYEKTLEGTMILNKNNMSGFGSCGGSGCYAYIFNFLNSKPELYRGSLCYQLVDNNTLTQIKCHSDNIIGYEGWEDETLHNIIYKRVG